MGVTYGDDADAVHLVEKSGDDYNSPALIEIHHQISDLQAPEKTSGLMFNPETGKLYIPCGNGITVNKATGMLEVPIGEHLRYTGSGLDVPDADETTAGVVKLTHEVSNRDDGEWVVTADGVYAYCPGYKTPPVNVRSLVTLMMQGTLDYAQVSNGWFMSIIRSPNANAGDAITLEGYGVSAAQAIAFVVNPSVGTGSVIAVTATTSGNYTDIAITADVTGDKLIFLLPVYKL